MAAGVGGGAVALSGPAERKTVRHMEAVLAVTYSLLRLADFCYGHECPCKNRSAAPAAPSLLRPLDALGAAANEITIYTYTTKTTKRLFFGRFVLFVDFVAFVIPLGERGIVISLKSLISWFSGGYREIVISLKPLLS